MRFAFYTLGCKTNQYETQAMEQLLTELGHEIGQFDQPCDGYIINTCSVTAVADKKNRAVIRPRRYLMCWTNWMKLQRTVLHGKGQPSTPRPTA